MKRSTKYLVPAVLVAICIGCESLVTNPRFAGEPRIVAVDFPGIPAEDVNLDQKSRTIKVKLPPVLPPNLRPEIQVAGDAFSSVLSWGNIFTEDVPNNRKIDLYGIGSTPQGQPPKVVATYALEFVPTGPLEIDVAALASYPTLSSGTVSPSIPFKNLYANDLPTQVRFTNRETRQTTVLDSNSVKLIGDNPYVRLFSRTWGSSPEQMNLLFVDVYHYGATILPGGYDVAFVTKAGNVLTVPAPIKILAGYPKVDSWDLNEVPRLLPGDEFIIKGRYLYPESITFRMLDVNDQPVPLQKLEIDPYGNQIKLKIPASAKFGPYLIGIKEKGSAGESCSMLYVTDKPLANLEIAKIFGYYSCSLKEPLVLTKNQEVRLLLNGAATGARLKLYGVSDSTAVYYASTKLAVPTQIGPKSTAFIPESIPTGLYRASMQVLDTKGNITYEGPKFWQIFEVK